MECKNCNTSLNSEQSYCFQCGAKVIKNRLTIKNLSADFSEQFLSYDNRFLKTFIDLAKQPEAVIESYINGTRKKYVNVIQYFAISLTLVGIQVFLMNTFFKEAMELDPNMFGVAIDPKSQEHNPFKDLKYEDFNNYQSLLYVLTIPFSAISTWLAYWVIGIRRYNFTEHTVINLYYSAQIIIVNAFLVITLLCFGVDFMLISYITTAVILIYFFYVLKRVFKTSFLEALGHFMLVMVAYGVLFIVISILAVIIAIIVFLIMKKS